MTQVISNRLHTQHGDRFTLFLKQYVESNTHDHNIKSIKHNVMVKTKNGTKAQIDLIIETQNMTLIIECKAFTKSKDYWLGFPKAISQRSNHIKRATTQAKRAFWIYNEYQSENRAPEHSNQKADWLVCTPTQEYLRPINKFGMLTPTIPKICTPEELCKFLNNIEQ